MVEKQGEPEKAPLLVFMAIDAPLKSNAIAGSGYFHYDFKIEFGITERRPVLNVTKEQKDNILIARLSGSIEENTNFDQLIGVPPGELHLYLKGVTRINSVGIKTWIKYFQGVNQRGTKLKLFECSTSIVEQINLISNFTCGGTVESIYVPFSCESCGTELVGLFKTDQLKQLQMKIPALKCSKCGKNAVFDDIPEEYFSFLARQ